MAEYEVLGPDDRGFHPVGSTGGSVYAYAATRRDADALVERLNTYSRIITRRIAEAGVARAASDRWRGEALDARSVLANELPYYSEEFAATVAWFVANAPDELAALAELSWDQSGVLDDDTKASIARQALGVEGGNS